jgi:hypothetical protein
VPFHPWGYVLAVSSGLGEHVGVTEGGAGENFNVKSIECWTGPEDIHTPILVTVKESKCQPGIEERAVSSNSDNWVSVRVGSRHSGVSAEHVILILLIFGECYDHRGNLARALDHMPQHAEPADVSHHFVGQALGREPGLEDDKGARHAAPSAQAPTRP